MKKKELLYEGKGKKLYTTEDENFLISELKDDLTAFNAEKKGNEGGRGALNYKISTELFHLFEKNGIRTHLVEIVSDNEQMVKKCKIVPIEVIACDVVTGSPIKRLGIRDGTVLPFALVEFCLKNDELGDPFINDEHCLILNLVQNEVQIKGIKEMAKKTNAILTPFFDTKNLRLIDFKIELGLTKDNGFVLADEISPDSCRFWDKFSSGKLDKDRFCQDLGNAKMVYEKVLRRTLN